nr:uncharacterized protein LOC113825291 [Penaeus vannamei]
MASNDESETTQSSLSTDSERSSSARKETCSCHFGTKGTADSSRLHRGSRDTLLPSLEGETSSRTHSSPVYTAISTPPSGRSSTAGMTPTSSWRTSGTMTTSTAATDWAATDSCDRGTCGVTTRPLQSLRIILVTRSCWTCMTLDGDVKVKLMGEKELLVEALSAGSSRTFRRSFSLPESTDMTSITPVMSSDGILTITVTKKETETQQKTTVIPISVKETHNAEVHSSTSSTTSGVSEEARLARERPTQPNRRNANPHDAIRRRSTRTRPKLQLPNFRLAGSKETLGSSQDDSLAIARRGSFLQDSFFSDIRRDFDASVREILKKCDDSDLTLTGDVSHSDILSRYRQLRSRNMREENQAFCVSSDSASQGQSPLCIVLDVHDFMRGDVKVKVVDEELVVEGRAEEEEGGSSVSTRSFSRRFALPHSTDMTRITSVMSSDGILTITALKTAGEPQQKHTR